MKQLYFILIFSFAFQVIGFTQEFRGGESYFGIYPNPSSNTVNVQLNNLAYNQVNLLIVNAEGKEVYRKERYDASTVEIHVEHWPAGVYFLSIQENGKAPLVRKFMVD